MINVYNSCMMRKTFYKEEILVIKVNKKIFNILFFVILLIILVHIIKIFILKAIYKTDYSEYVEKYSKKYGVEKELIFAIIKNESNFNENAISKSNANGLMQVMKSTAEEVANKYNINLTDDNIFEPEINIEIGTIYISILLNKYGNNELALAAYNAGYGNVDKWIGQNIIKSDASDVENIPYKETNMYVRKVIRDYNIYKGQICA